MPEHTPGSMELSEKNWPAPAPLPLRDEAEVMRTWRNRGTPEVSICCASFNHRPYIEDALHGFLAQETYFPFEILVRDDASTDGTIEILKDYAVRYPNIIRLHIENENTYVQGQRATFVMASLARGRFVALCEGDDYWFVRGKLQKQYELLKHHPDSPMSIAWTLKCVQRDTGLACEAVINNPQNVSLVQTWEDNLRDYFHTSTFFCRIEALRSALSLFDHPEQRIYFSDTPLRRTLATQGPLLLLPEVVSVYRYTGEGVWSSLDRRKRIEWDIGCTRYLFKNADGAARHNLGLDLLDLHLLMLRQGRFRFTGKGGLANLAALLALAGRYLPAYLAKTVRRRLGHHAAGSGSRS